MIGRGILVDKSKGGKLDDGQVCLTNIAAERALRCVVLGRKS